MALVRLYLCTIILSIVLPLSSGLKFDLQAHPGHNANAERCIRNFVPKDTLVLVTAIVGGEKGDGQMVNMHVGPQFRRRWSAMKQGGLSRALRLTAFYH